MFLVEAGGTWFLTNREYAGAHEVTGPLDTHFQKHIRNSEDKNCTAKDSLPAHTNVGLYNLGDKLNMPRVNHAHLSTAAAWNNPVSWYLKTFRTALTDFPDTILHYYYHQHNDHGEIPPSIARLKYAVSEYLAVNNTEHLLNEVSQKDTRVIHLRTGDRGDMEDDASQHLARVAQGFDKHIVCLGMHNSRYHNNDKAFTVFYNTCENVLRQLGDNCRIFLGGADQHCSIMCKALNLYVHKGGFSCMVSLLCEGNIYCSPEFNPLREDGEVWLRMRGETPVMSIRDADGMLVDTHERLAQIKDRKLKERKVKERKARRLKEREARQLKERKAWQLKEREAKELKERKANERMFWRMRF